MITYVLVLIICVGSDEGCTPTVAREDYTTAQNCYIDGAIMAAKMGKGKRYVKKFVCMDSKRLDHFLGWNKA